MFFSKSAQRLAIAALVFGLIQAVLGFRPR